MGKKTETLKQDNCLARMMGVGDALDVINGKWKVKILISIMHGNKRFGEIQRSVPKINPKVLAKELKDLEENKLIKRTVHDDYPVMIEYTATDYVMSLQKVMDELYNWGINHHKKVFAK